MQYIISAYKFLGRILFYLKPGVLKKMLAPWTATYWPRHWLFSANALSISRLFFFWASLGYTMYFELPLLNITMCLGFLFTCASDFFDGVVAYALKTESQIGGYLDQFCDKLTINPLLVLFSWNDSLLFSIVCLLCVLDAASLYIKTVKLRDFLVECKTQGIDSTNPAAKVLAKSFNSNANNYGKWKMALQCVALILLAFGLLTLPVTVLCCALVSAGISVNTQVKYLTTK